MNHRYRTPDAVKERQAQDLKRRFAKYSQGKPKETNQLLKAAVLIALVALFWIALR